MHSSQIPPTSAAWSFSFDLRGRPNPFLFLRYHRLQPRGSFNFSLNPPNALLSDPTDFSRVELQFDLRGRPNPFLFLRYHRLQPRGASVSTQEADLTLSSFSDTTG